MRSTNCGSFDSFQESCRWGWSPKARQIRDTEVCDRPSSAANARVDQWVALFGEVSSVRVITCSTCSSATVRGRPGRGSSKSPSDVARRAHPVSWARSWSVNVGSGCCSASCATPPTLSRPSRRATTGAGSVAATRRGAATTTTPSPTDRTPRVRRAPEDDLRKDPAGRSAPPRGAGGSGGGRHRVPRRTLPRVEGVNDLRRSRTRWAALSSKS